MHVLCRQPYVFNRWICFTAGIIVILLSGVRSHNYQAISGEILGFTIFSFIPAIIADKFGSRVTTLLSSLLAFLGTILQLTTTNIWLSMLFACLIGIGVRGLFFAATISNLRNFEPKIRGAIMCLLYCVLYVSSSFNDLPRHAYNEPLAPAQIIVSSICVILNAIIGFVFLNEIPKPTEEESEQIEVVVEPELTPWQICKTKHFYMIVLLSSVLASTTFSLFFGFSQVIASWDIKALMEELLRASSLFGFVLIAVAVSVNALLNTFTSCTLLRVCAYTAAILSLILCSYYVPLMITVFFLQAVLHGGMLALVQVINVEHFGTKYFCTNHTIVYLLSQLLSRAVGIAVMSLVSLLDPVSSFFPKFEKDTTSKICSSVCYDSHLEPVAYIIYSLLAFIIVFIFKKCK